MKIELRTKMVSHHGLQTRTTESSFNIDLVPGLCNNMNKLSILHVNYHCIIASHFLVTETNAHTGIFAHKR